MPIKLSRFTRRWLARRFPLNVAPTGVVLSRAGATATIGYDTAGWLAARPNRFGGTVAASGALLLATAHFGKGVKEGGQFRPNAGGGGTPVDKTPGLKDALQKRNKKKATGRAVIQGEKPAGNHIKAGVKRSFWYMPDTDTGVDFDPEDRAHASFVEEQPEAFGSADLKKTVNDLLAEEEDAGGVGEFNDEIASLVVDRGTGVRMQWDGKELSIDARSDELALKAAQWAGGEPKALFLQITDGEGGLSRPYEIYKGKQLARWLEGKATKPTSMDRGHTGSLLDDL